jgi:hypothetical protein
MELVPSNGMDGSPSHPQAERACNRRRAAMAIETLGIDIAKNVFQLHGVNTTVASF